MSPVSSRILSVIDEQVCSLIVGKYGLSEIAATRAYLESETYAMVLDPLTRLYLASPLVIFDLWESERVTGDPRNSRYIRED